MMSPYPVFTYGIYSLRIPSWGSQSDSHLLFELKRRGKKRRRGRKSFWSQLRPPSASHLCYKEMKQARKIPYTHTYVHIQIYIEQQEKEEGGGKGESEHNGLIWRSAFAISLSRVHVTRATPSHCMPRSQDDARRRGKRKEIFLVEWRRGEGILQPANAFVRSTKKGKGERRRKTWSQSKQKEEEEKK